MLFDVRLDAGCVGVIYGSVCSGIEAASVAWQPLGWKAAFYSEIEKFPRAVLAHRYPDVPLHGDFTTIGADNYGPIDILVGGTPCQSFSIAGLRGGLADDRGNLALEYLRLAERKRPRWLVWENVPGVLSSNGGRDFGSILGALAELGYGFAYRVLDAQYFGVAQRRKRVFVVGYLGDWRRAAAVLFERHSLQGNIAPRREKGEKVAPTVTTGAPFSRTGNESVECEAIVPVGYTSTSFGGYHQGVGTIRAAGGDLGGGSETLCVSQTIAFSSKQQSMKTSDNVANTLGANDYKEPQAVAYDSTVTGALNTQLGLRGPDVSNSLREGVGIGNVGDPAFTLQASHGHGVITPSQVRRLTPIECERLQGFPDNYTDIRLNDKQTPDGPRYKAMGNSMAVPVMNWIGRRIQMVEDTE